MIDERLSKWDVEPGDWITMFCDLDLVTHFKMYVEAGELKTRERSVERIKSGSKLYVEGVEHGRIYAALAPSYEYVDGAIDDLDFGIHYRPINDPSRYKRRLL